MKGQMFSRSYEGEDFMIYPHQKQILCLLQPVKPPFFLLLPAAYGFQHQHYFLDDEKGSEKRKRMGTDIEKGQPFFFSPDISSEKFLFVFVVELKQTTLLFLKFLRVCSLLQLSRKKYGGFWVDS